MNTLILMAASSMTMMMAMETPLTLWIFMEISNILFIMMFTLMQQKYTNTSATMMLIQFFSSTLIFMGIIESNNIMMSLGIITKLGMTPAHNWMPMVIYLSPWKLNMFTMIMPKIPPFLMMDMLSSMNLMYLSVCTTPLIATIKLIKTSNNKIIMALSSMIHSSWMVMAYSTSMQSWIVYMVLYSINTIMMCTALSKNIPSNLNTNTTTKMITMMMMFSMMGVPPITMFMGKLFVMLSTNFLMALPLMALILSSAVSIIYYSRIFTQTIFLHKKNNKVLVNAKQKQLKWIIFMALMMLI